MSPVAITSRYETIPEIVTCMMRIFRESNGKWHEHIKMGTVREIEKILDRLLRKGRKIIIAWEWDEYYHEP